MEQPTLLEIYARLVKLREHLPEGEFIEERYIFEYNDLLFSLAHISSANLDGFSIPESELHVKDGSYYVTKTGTMAQHPSAHQCQRPYFLMKLDAVLLFFEIQTNNTKNRQVGFVPPNN